jgi:DNA-binding NarL/FixJ family response regulator
MRAVEQQAAPDAPHARRSGAVTPSLVAALGDRELEVLRLLAAGKPNQEIADRLHVTRHTVKKHVSRIFDKLGAANVTEATARASELGLLS